MATRKTDAGKPAHAAKSPSHRGHGGETHEQAGDGFDPLTTAQGIPVSDNQNSLRAFERGPTLLEDFVLREKITHFDHERIPERIVHARGSGAHGYFELTKSLSKYTTAKLFTETKVRTPVFTRFSTVAVHSTRVSPKVTRTEPSAWRVKPRWMRTSRICAGARPLGRGDSVMGGLPQEWRASLPSAPRTTGCPA